MADSRQFIKFYSAVNKHANFKNRTFNFTLHVIIGGTICGATTSTVQDEQTRGFLVKFYVVVKFAGKSLWRILFPLLLCK